MVRPIRRRERALPGHRNYVSAASLRSSTAPTTRSRSRSRAVSSRLGPSMIPPQIRPRLEATPLVAAASGNNPQRSRRLSSCTMACSSTILRFRLDKHTHAPRFRHRGRFSNTSSRPKPRSLRRRHPPVCPRSLESWRRYSNRTLRQVSSIHWSHYGAPSSYIRRVVQIPDILSVEYRGFVSLPRFLAVRSVIVAQRSIGPVSPRLQNPRYCLP